MNKKLSFQPKLLRNVFIFLILIVEIIVFSLLTDRFLTITNITNVLRQISFVGIVSFGMTILIISRGLDLSVGSVLALAGCVSAYVIYFGYPTWIAVVVGVLVGLIAGFINGVLVVYTKISTVIVTLGMMYMARGIVYIITGGGPIFLDMFPGFGFIGRGYLGPIPVPVVFFVTILAIFWFIMGKTAFGKYIYAVGSNFEAARLSGINVNNVRLYSYIITGALSGFAGVLMISRLASGQPSMGTGFEFDVIVAVLLGGTSLAGGEGSVIGSTVGALIVGIINNGLNLLGVSAWYQSVFKGGILIIAVLMDNILKQKGMGLVSIKGLFKKKNIY